MFLLRRAAARAVAAPSSAILFKPRSITTSAVGRSWTKQQASVSFIQRRLASDQDPTRSTTESSVQPTDESLASQEEAPPVTLDSSSAVQSSNAIPSSSIAGDPRVLYVGNLFYDVDTSQLQRIFGRFGEIEKVRIVYDGRNVSRGFGYVTFEKEADALAAMRELDMQVLEGRNLVVQMHKPRELKRHATRTPDSPPSNTLFIGNMSYEMADKDLNDLFRDIENVIDVRVAIDRSTGQPRGFAHADFVDVASAQIAKEQLDNKIVYGRALRVDFSKPATPRPRNKELLYEDSALKDEEL